MPTPENVRHENLDPVPDCPAVDPWPCGVQWFPEYCDRYNNVPGTCRIMCGECPGEYKQLHENEISQKIR